MNSVKKSPQRKPGVAQLKTAVSAQSVRQPVAPPAYRPQPVPRVLQKKSAIGPHTKPIAIQPKMAGSSQVNNRPVAPPVYKPQPVPKVLQTKMAAGQHSPAVQPKRAPVSVPAPRQHVKPSGPPSKMAGHNSRSVQLAPGPAYMALAPRPAGIAIPVDANGRWVRPDWLRGQAHSAMTIRNEVAATRRPDMVAAGLNFYKCGLCGQLATLNGLSVDHSGDWRDWCASRGAHDLQSLEQAYHDMTNLRLVHNNCNASKGTKDIFDWWKSNSAPVYVQAANLALIHGALDRIYRTMGVDWLYEIPEAARMKVVDGIIRQAELDAQGNVNAFEHLMGNGAIVSALGGWGQGQ